MRRWGVLVAAVVFSLPAPMAHATVPVLVLDGSGFGHGVGLAQDGAFWMGRAGTDTAGILGQFYPGTRLGKAAGPVRVALATSRSGQALLAFPGGGEVRDAPTDPQPPGFPVRVPPGGQVLVRFDGNRYSAELLAGDRSPGPALDLRTAGAQEEPSSTTRPVVPLPLTPPDPVTVRQVVPTTVTTTTTTTTSPSTTTSTATTTTSTATTTTAPPSTTTTTPGPLPPATTTTSAPPAQPVPPAPPTPPVTQEPSTTTTTAPPPAATEHAPVPPEPRPAPPPGPPPPLRPGPPPSPPPPPPPSTARSLWAVPAKGETVALPAIGRRYRDMVEATGISPGVASLRFINEIGVEDYLRGMGEVRDPSWPPASLRAQAIAARTYALRAMKTSGEICADQRCQVYLGQQAEYRAMDEAVSQTAGQVVLFGGRLASTVYSANAGGMSASTEEGFGPTVAASASAFPYLRPAPYLTRDPGQWSVSVALDRVAGRLSYPGTVSSVSVSQVGPSGRALTVALEGTAGPRAVPGVEFASALGLRSTLFRTRLDVAEQAPALTPAAPLQVPPEQAAAAAAAAPPPAPGSPEAASSEATTGGSTGSQPAGEPDADRGAPSWPAALFGLSLAVCLVLASRRRIRQAQP
jgi:SpoIID/LytB domain protein